MYVCVAENAELLVFFLFFLHIPLHKYFHGPTALVCLNPNYLFGPEHSERQLKSL